MTRELKQLLSGLLIGVIVTVFIYQAYGIQRLRSGLVQQQEQIYVLQTTIGQVVEIINQSSAQ